MITKFKDISAKELKVAVKELNPYLEEKNYEKIKIAGKKPGEVLDYFIDAISTLIENNDHDVIPDAVVDFYNKNIAGGEEEVHSRKKESKKSKNTKAEKKEPKEEEKKEEEKSKKKRVMARRSKKKKKDTKKLNPPTFEEKLEMVGNEEFAFLLLTAGYSEEEIAKEFLKHYRDRGVADEEFVLKRAKIYTGIAKRIKRMADEAKALVEARNKGEE